MTHIPGESIQTCRRLVCVFIFKKNDDVWFLDSDGKSVTPRELIQYISREEHETIIDAALQEMTNTFFHIIRNDDHS
jgi:hypothetical protein